LIVDIQKIFDAMKRWGRWPRKEDACAEERLCSGFAKGFAAGRGEGIVSLHLVLKMESD
jgi:hypothetical protein